MDSELALTLERLGREMEGIHARNSVAADETGNAWQGRDAQEFKARLLAIGETVSYIADRLRSAAQPMA